MGCRATRILVLGGYREFVLRHGVLGLRVESYWVLGCGLLLRVVEVQGLRGFRWGLGLRVSLGFRASGLVGVQGPVRV